jgi:hypothetical protein
MEVITIESKAYKEIISRLDKIALFVRDHAPDDEWVDGHDVSKYLKVSIRTLQRLRKKHLLNYSLSSGKAMYKISEVKRMLDENLIKSDPQNLQDLIDNFNNLC